MSETLALQRFKNSLQGYLAQLRTASPGLLFSSLDIGLEAQINERARQLWPKAGNWKVFEREFPGGEKHAGGTVMSLYEASGGTSKFSLVHPESDDERVRWPKNTRGIPQPPREHFERLETLHRVFVQQIEQCVLSWITKADDALLVNEAENPQQPAGEDGGKAGSGAAFKEPSPDAFKAYRACTVLGKTQTDVAKELNVKQWKVSRWVKKVSVYIQAGNILPDLPRLAGKPVAVDPAVIEMGEREDHRTRRQRPATSDDDDE